MCFASFLLCHHFIRPRILRLSYSFLMLSYNKNDNNSTEETKKGSTLGGGGKFKIRNFITHLEISNEVIRKELKISGTQDVKSKYKQNWINHLERMDNTRLPKHALKYKPRGRGDRGRSKKRWQCVDTGTGQKT